MPNQITNRIKFKANKEKIKEVMEFLRIKDNDDQSLNVVGTIDFNSITPTPRWIFQGGLT